EELKQQIEHKNLQMILNFLITEQTKNDEIPILGWNVPMLEDELIQTNNNIQEMDPNKESDNEY
ncbi:4131_t:CDS:2, partial [Gigaspora margarita]